MSKSNYINVAQLAYAVQQELKEFQYVADAAVQKAVDKTAKQTAENVKANASASVGGTGAYASSWTYGHRITKGHNFKMTVYSDAPGYRLAHLLEKGHALKRGGRDVGKTEAFKHIAPAEEAAKKLLVENIKEELEK